MRSTLVIGVFAFLLIGGSVFLAMGQTPTYADNVVINEIDINPPGDDSKTVSEWIELYNPTDTEINVGGWSIASTTVLKQTMIIPVGTLIPPNGFLTYSYKSVWFTDVSELVQLRDADGIVIDETPSISDINNDFSSWQRIYDGFDTDSLDDWEFERSNAGSTNGKFVADIETEGATITVSVDNNSYIFDETAIIHGQVTEQLFVEKPYFQAEQIKIKIFGPNGYEKNVSLYPDFLLNYETTLGLKKVLGFSEGVYYIVVEYGNSVASTQFTLGDEIVLIEETPESEFSISTDKESYIPGDTAKILASTNDIVPFEGLKFKVTNPDGKQIFDGTLYPDKNGKFTTTLYMTTVNPVYGFHKIVADYATYSSVSSFEVSEDIKEDKPISLKTDKKAYALGETVIITGRLNDLWIFSLDLEILQTGFGSLDTGISNRLKIQDSVRLEGDSTFRYEFEIPNNTKRYGDYKVTVSKSVGTESIIFHVVENPDSFVESTIPLSVQTDKAIYEVGDPITISGKVNNQQSSSTFQSPSISIAIKNLATGSLFTSASKPSSSEPAVILYSLSAVPDQVGNYKVTDTLYNAIYSPGEYMVTASYADGFLKDSTTFSVIDSLDIEGMSLTLDKEVYGLGEKVFLTGLVPTGGAGKADVEIKITKPDGDTDKFGTTVENGRFSWSWLTPQSEKPNVVQNERVLYSSNYGVYKISVAQSDNAPVVIFFKVSPNPEEDSLNIIPLTVTTQKPIYNAGEKLKIIGSALKRVQGTQGLVVPDRVDITIKSPSGKSVLNSAVYLDNGGNFESTFDTPVTVFKEGTYKVVAVYQGIRAENFFQVDNDFIFGGEEKLSLLIGTDKEQYHPGDVAIITARPSKMIFVETIQVGIPAEEQTKLNCGSFICGIGVPITTLKQDRTGTFNYMHTFPITSKLGTHIITFDTEFGTFKKPIQLVEKIPEPEEQSVGQHILEKFNRLTESEIQITINEKNIDGKEVSPRVIQGSLFAPMRGQEANVNIKVSTEDGTCIIGPDSECMVLESTRVPGAIYKTIQIDGMDYNVRYTGPDVTLEKFTILPVDSDVMLPDSTWNVQVLKDDQSSHVYYKVTYVTLE